MDKTLMDLFKFMTIAYLDVFVVLLLQRLQLLWHVRRDGGPAWHPVDGTVAVGVDQEAFLTAVFRWLHANAKLAKFSSGVRSGHQLVIKE